MNQKHLARCKVLCCGISQPNWIENYLVVVHAGAGSIPKLLRKEYQVAIIAQSCNMGPSSRRDRSYNPEHPGSAKARMQKMVEEPKLLRLAHRLVRVPVGRAFSF